MSEPVSVARCPPEAAKQAAWYRILNLEWVGGWVGWLVGWRPSNMLVCLRGPPRWPSGKASASRAEDPGFESRLRRDFFEVESHQ